MNNYNAISKRMPDGTIDHVITLNLKSENDIFKYDNNSEIVVITEEDGNKYYIHLGLFIVKIPFDYADGKIKDNDFDFWKCIEEKIIDYILNDYYYNNNDGFEDYLKSLNYNIDEIKSRLDGADNSVDAFCNYYYDLVDFFDNWAVIKTDTSFQSIDRIIIKKRSLNHIETIDWEWSKWMG